MRYTDDTVQPLGNLRRGPDCVETRMARKGPQHSQRPPYTTPRGLEDRCLLAVTINDFPIPTPTACLGITAGPDGNLWFTEGIGNKIGESPRRPRHHRVRHPHRQQQALSGSRPGPTATSGSPRTATRSARSTRRPTPSPSSPSPPPTADPGGITAGPDGNLWFTEYVGDQIGEINPTRTHHRIHRPHANSVPSTSPPGPTATSGSPRSANKIGEITPTTHASPSSPSPRPTRPCGITAGPDGNLWFTETTANKIGGSPRRRTHHRVLRPHAQQRAVRITAGPDGNLWFTEIAGNKIGESPPTTARSPNSPSPQVT